MRNISFMLTTQQFRERTKTVTRRVGWSFLRIGEVLMGVEKCQGLKRGEKMVRLGAIRVLDVRREPLSAITAEDCVREGFPHFTPDQFVAMFCEANRCDPGSTVTRIEFEYVDSGADYATERLIAAQGGMEL